MAPRNEIAATGSMVTVSGSSSAVVVLPLIPGSAPTTTPRTVPATMRATMYGSPSIAMPPRNPSIAGALRPKCAEEPGREQDSESAHEHRPNHEHRSPRRRHERQQTPLAPQAS